MTDLAARVERLTNALSDIERRVSMLESRPRVDAALSALEDQAKGIADRLRALESDPDFQL